MKITAVRLFEVRGEMSFPGEFWEERLVRPVDIYPEHKWNTIHQFFLKNPIVPVNGEVTLPTGPGIGMELDESKVMEKRDLSFD